MTDYGWRGDPALLVVAADGTAGRDHLARLIRDLEPDWFVDAACRQPEHATVEFHPERGRSAAPALKVCASCQVVEQCRSWALADATLVGIYGATTGRQRQRIRARGES